jgi:hypothetical protein
LYNPFANRRYRAEGAGLRLHLRATRATPLTCFILLIPAVLASFAGQRAPATKTDSLKVIEVKEPDGQILSYRHLAGSMEVLMRGTSRAPEARIKLKIGSRPGFVELDINRGGISGLKPAHRLGKDFLTYVVWAVSVDGRASNLGEITFEDDRPISVNLTTPYQTFWLMVTAEPNYAVVDPSPQVVLYSVKDKSATVSTAITIPGDLFFYTHYSSYETAPGALEPVPNQLLQARKAVELASKAGILSTPTGGSAGLKEEDYTRKALLQARMFLSRAEDVFKKDPKRPEVIQFARTSAQSAENARALSMGAVGGLVVRQLESEVATLRAELAGRKFPASAAPVAPPSEAPTVVSEPPPSAPVAAAPEPPPPPPAAPIAPPLVKQPALWFALAGWGLAIVLLFRRQSI